MSKKEFLGPPRHDRRGMTGSSGSIYELLNFPAGDVGLLTVIIRGHPERREKSRYIWSLKNWGWFLAPPPRAATSMAGVLIPIVHVILKEIARQQ